MKDIIKKTNECLSCIKKPCTNGCPLNNDIPEFIKLVKEEKVEEAYKVLSNTTVLPSICGRICPKERQCQGSCVKKIKGQPVEIGNIESYIGDYSIKNNLKLPSKKLNKYKVAVIGSGPASLTCAAFLRREGYNVTIYEKYDYLGGLLVHGIPDFRLDKKIVKESIEKILDTGINVEYNMELGNNLLLEDIEKEYDAIFIGIGSNISRKMNIEGEGLNGVYGGNELLEKEIKLDYKDKTVIVSGGGNVAIDVARVVKRQNAKKVIIVYRRSKEEMPADETELNEALKDGVEILYQTNILKINGTDKVENIEVIKTELVKKENETRLTPVNIEGTNYNINCDYVMMAVGSIADKNITTKLNIELDKNNKIIVNHKYQTSNKKIFAGGDIANVEATVAYAARSGRDAAISIMEYLNER
ncbi:MAG: FAD-dependent oxidoreductase [Bacilli bacterium]|nr:FAD-dependent oxidoreductase [Bacilli bacterium]